jgi:phosphotransferase system HPr (HPr) family protein
MKTFTIKVTNMGGLTGRSSAELVEEANHHKCNITLLLESGESCDLKSIMNVFAMPPVLEGDVLTIQCDGEDEEKAVKGFEKLSLEYIF